MVRVGGQILVTELAGPGSVMVSGTNMLGLDMLRLSRDLAVDSWNIFHLIKMETEQPFQELKCIFME